MNKMKRKKEEDAQLQSPHARSGATAGPRAELKFTTTLNYKPARMKNSSAKIPRPLLYGSRYSYTTILHSEPRLKSFLLAHGLNIIVFVYAI